MKNDQDVRKIEKYAMWEAIKGIRATLRRWESRGDMRAVLKYLKRFCVKTDNGETSVVRNRAAWINLQ